MTASDYSPISANPSYIIPQWPVPAHVRAVTTTRCGGFSQAPFASFNFGEHVGDDVTHLELNRRKLQQDLELPGQPLWITQVHGINVVCADNPPDDLTADASYTCKPGVACAITTADCLPIILTSTAAPVVAALHAGWRGLAGGVIEATIAALPVPASSLMAWIGPAISQPCYEVADGTRAEFLNKDTASAAAFVPTKPGHWLADLVALAQLYLNNSGVTQIYGGDLCTYSDSERLYSYRRASSTGRMATLIWML